MEDLYDRASKGTQSDSLLMHLINFEGRYDVSN